MLAHYGAVADAARVADPDRKGTVEQNAWLAHWEERWAAPRIHGRKKRPVLAMFAEEKPAFKALPATRFRYFRETSHTVDDSGLVQVLRSYYAAIPASPGDIVTVRLYEHDIEILDAAGELLRRHPRSMKPGHFEIRTPIGSSIPHARPCDYSAGWPGLGPAASRSAAISSCA